ncbi:MAG: hypothetical protein HG467_003680 [Clostridiales bacterium]|nr:hypothetical protein [Clostridiales bacterium]
MFKKFTWKTLCVIILVIAILINVTVKLIQVSPFTKQLNSVITRDNFTEEEIKKVTEDQKKNGIYLEKNIKEEKENIDNKEKDKDKGKEEKPSTINNQEGNSNIQIINENQPQLETNEVKNGITNQGKEVPVVSE